MERIVCSSGTINFRQYENTYNTVKEYKERREKKAGTIVLKILTHKQKIMASAHSNYLPPITETQPSIITRGTTDSPPKKAQESQKRSQSKAEDRSGANKNLNFAMTSKKKDADLLKSVEIKTKVYKAILPKPPGVNKKDEGGRIEVQQKMTLSTAFEPQKKQSVTKKISSSVEGKDLRSSPFKHDNDEIKKKVSAKSKASPDDSILAESDF